MNNIEQPQNERINENTHTKINLLFLVKVFGWDNHISWIVDCFDILAVIVYFRIRDIHETYAQKIILNSFFAVFILFLINLFLRFAKVFNASRYYGQQLPKRFVNKNILFEKNIYVIVCFMFVIELFHICAIPILYYFVPFTKSTMCEIYGNVTCNLIKSFCTIELILLPISSLICFFGILMVPIVLEKGILKNIVLFVSNNIMGLLFGNAITTIFYIVDHNYE
jgi:hypothetical protein